MDGWDAPPGASAPGASIARLRARAVRRATGTHAHAHKFDMGAAPLSGLVSGLQQVPTKACPSCGEPVAGGWRAAAHIVIRHPDAATGMVAMYSVAHSVGARAAAFCGMDLHEHPENYCTDSYERAESQSGLTVLFETEETTALDKTKETGQG